MLLCSLDERQGNLPDQLVLAEHDSHSTLHSSKVPIHNAGGFTVVGSFLADAQVLLQC